MTNQVSWHYEWWDRFCFGFHEGSELSWLVDFILVQVLEALIAIGITIEAMDAQWSYEMEYDQMHFVLITILILFCQLQADETAHACNYMELDTLVEW